MSHAKALVAIILITFCFTAVAKLNEPNMNDKKILVIGYDYHKERVLKESTAKLHQNSETTFHGQGDVSVEILGEKNKIVIPGISESFLLFKNNFSSVELYLLPTNRWLTLDYALKKIQEMNESLDKISPLSLKTEAFDINKLTAKHFEESIGEVIREYDLQHYKVFFIIKKLTTPKEIQPRDQDYFQLIVRVDNKSR